MSQPLPTFVVDVAFDAGVAEQELTDTFDAGRISATTMGSANSGQPWAASTDSVWGVAAAGAYCVSSSGVGRALVNASRSGTLTVTAAAVATATEFEFAYADASNYFSVYNNGTTWQVYKFIAGASTLLATGSDAPAAGDVIVVKVGAVLVGGGNNLNVTVGSKLSFSANDADLAAGAGAYVGFSSTGANAARWDTLSTVLSWSDISAYVLGVDTHRGKQFELDRIEAGTATFTLSNIDRRFEPANASSPYFPGVVPYRRIRLRATWSAVTYAVWSGFAERWGPVYANRNAVVTVPAVDALGLTGASSPSGTLKPYATEVLADSPQGYFRLGDVVSGGGTVANSGPAGYGATASVHGGLTRSFPGLCTSGDEGAAVFPGGGAAVAYIDCQTGVAIVGAGSFSFEAVIKTTAGGLAPCIYGQCDAYWGTAVELALYTGGVVWLSTPTQNLYGVTNVADDKPHHIVAVRNAAAGTASIYVDGRLDATSAFTVDTITAPSQVGIGWRTARTACYPGTLDEVAIYPRALSAERVLAHATASGAVAISGGDTTGARVNRIADAVGLARAGRSVATGVATVAPVNLVSTDARAHLDAMATAEDSMVFVDGAGALVFLARDFAAVVGTDIWGDDASSGSEYGYRELTLDYGPERIYNDVTVTRDVDQGTAYEVSDGPSRLAYLTRPLAIAVPYDTDAQAQALAPRLLARYLRPQVRVESLTIKGAQAGGIWNHVLNRDLGARTSVRRRPPTAAGAAAAVTTGAYIEAIEHHVSPSDWTTTWRLAPVPWVLGDVAASVLGTSTVLGTA